MYARTRFFYYYYFSAAPYVYNVAQRPLTKAQTRTRMSKLTRPRHEPQNQGSIRGSGRNYLPMLATACRWTLPFHLPPFQRVLSLGANRDQDNKTKAERDCRTN